jgi:hypothetical protein
VRLRMRRRRQREMAFHIARRPGPRERGVAPADRQTPSSNRRPDCAPRSRRPIRSPGPLRPRETTLDRRGLAARLLDRVARLLQLLLRALQTSANLRNSVRTAPSVSHTSDVRCSIATYGSPSARC